ncbi:MAG: winged helix-turn-helix domain-containing protein [Vicinamibacteria bacterium]
MPKLPTGPHRSGREVCLEASSHAWHFEATSREIVRDGRRTRLAEKPFMVLEALVAARGEVVTRAALQKRLWSNETFVDFDNNLNSAIATLRQALGDSGRSPQFIETIPKVGYRLLRPPRGPEANQGTAARRGAPLLMATVATSLVVAAVLALLAFGARRSRPSAPRAVSGVAAAQVEFELGSHLRARYLLARQDLSQLKKAREAFGRARILDAEFVAAPVEEADTLVELSFAGGIGFRHGLAQARELAREALGRDPENGGAMRVMGLASLFVDWDFDAAGPWIARAAASPSADARTALAQATYLAAVGRTDDAVAAAERAVALDPASYFVRADLALFYLAAGRLEAAADASRLVLEAAPDFMPALANAVLAHERLQRWEAAAPASRALLRETGAPAEILARAERADPREAVRAWHEWDLARVQAAAKDGGGDHSLELALRHAVAGDRVVALDHLERAFARRSPLLVFLRSFPELDSLRDDPRFQRIDRALGGS